MRGVKLLLIQPNKFNTIIINRGSKKEKKVLLD